MSDTHPKYSNTVTPNPFYWRKCDQVDIRIRRFKINIRCFEINRVFFTSYVASARRCDKSRVVSRSLAKPKKIRNKKKPKKKNQKKVKIRRKKLLPAILTHFKLLWEMPNVLCIGFQWRNVPYLHKIKIL